MKRFVIGGVIIDSLYSFDYQSIKVNVRAPGGSLKTKHQTGKTKQVPEFQTNSGIFVLKRKAKNSGLEQVFQVQFVGLCG